MKKSEKFIEKTKKVVNSYPFAVLVTGGMIGIGPGLLDISWKENRSLRVQKEWLDAMNEAGR